MPTAYFRKYGGAVVRVNGARVDFAGITPLVSLLETGDEGLAKALRDIEAARKSGVSELTFEQYQDLKKKHLKWIPSVHSKPGYREHVPTPPTSKAAPRSGVAAAAAETPGRAASGPATVLASELEDIPA